MSADVAALRREAAELARLVELREQLVTHPHRLERRAVEVQTAIAHAEHEAKLDRLVAGKDYEAATAAYVTAREEAFDAIRALVAALDHARELRALLNASHATAAKLGALTDAPVKPEPASVRASRSPELRGLLQDLRAATARDF